MMEIETLQGADMENGTVRPVRIKERKKEDWERDMRKKNKEASRSNSNSNLVHACTLGD